MLFQCFLSEWRKKRRSMASWALVVGAFFTPLIITIARLAHPDKLQALYSTDYFWFPLWKNSWESMSIFLLPMGIILITGLLLQLEFKNNTWKQVHTLPVSLTSVFVAKLAVIIVMLLEFFVLFNAGIYLSAIIPCAVMPEVPYPRAPLPIQFFLWENFHYAVDCLPILMLQFLISLRYRNFLLPIGLGFMFWFGSLAAVSWEYGYVIPYTYGMYHYFRYGSEGKGFVTTANIDGWAAVYTAVFLAAAYLLYITKKEKG